jgi:hypothetical protein
VTVSCLPGFCQPYRLVANATIEAFFGGGSAGRDVLVWGDLLQRYRRAFERWHPRLAAICGGFFGRPPPRESARGFWLRVVGGCGGLAAATARLVHDLGITFFGKYRCHQRRALQV